MTQSHSICKLSHARVFVIFCSPRHERFVQVSSVTEKLIKITCESFLELGDGNEYAILVSS